MKFSIFEMMSRISGLLSTSISKEQAKDSGMAFTLLMLLIGLIANNDLFFMVAAAALLVNMISPMAFYPFAVFWFGISGIIGAIVSRILLLVIYVLVLLPVALLRQMTGKDPLLLRKFKKSEGSSLRPRHHHFTASDLEKPF